MSKATRFPLKTRDVWRPVLRRPLSADAWITALYIYYGRLYYRRRAEAIDGMLRTADRRMANREAIGKVTDVLPLELTTLKAKNSNVIYGVDVHWPHNNVERIYGHCFPYYAHLARMWGTKYTLKTISHPRA